MVDGKDLLVVSIVDGACYLVLLSVLLMKEAGCISPAVINCSL